MSKKILILGVGAQGSAIARMMDKEPNVSEIICADYNQDAAMYFEKKLTKVRGAQVDGSNLDSVVALARGVDLIVNAMPVEFNQVIYEAALKVKANYQDMAGGVYTDIDKYLERYIDLLENGTKKFEDAGITAVVGTGATPGLANITVREAVDKLDTCDKIGIYIYDEVVPNNKWLPFWWSPDVAFPDMRDDAYIFENGKIIKTKAHSRPRTMNLKGIDKPVRMVEHTHDEPITMGFYADKILKGAKNIEFKYGGPSVNLSERLLQLGILSDEPVEINGCKVAPIDVLLKVTPRPPQTEEEIQAIIDDGLAIEQACMLIRVEGTKDGQKVRIDSYVNAPGLEESFKRAKITHDSYVIGQSAGLVTKMLVNDVITQKGLFPPEVLNKEERAYFFKEAEKLGITIDENWEELSI
ncbi:MAG: saccharopine dehydrogenase NADP-binding domain-containing protein [Desulfobacterales bacterium]|nr:saccharopine dehydrogenase NADP-binding domain-containing protein [Desulfobacterales bacterium]